MVLLAIALQREGIAFVEASAVHRQGRMHVTEFVAETEDDLRKFAMWAAREDVNFDDARVATPAELAASKEWS